MEWDVRYFFEIVLLCSPVGLDLCVVSLLLLLERWDSRHSSPCLHGSVPPFCLWICAGACQGRCMDNFHLFLVKTLLSWGLQKKKMIILFFCHLGLSKATFQACLLSLQPVFCKSSTLSRRHLDSPSLSLRCGDYYTFWSFRSTYPYLSGKFQRYTKVELAHVLAIQL